MAKGIFGPTNPYYGPVQQVFYTGTGATTTANQQWVWSVPPSYGPSSWPTPAPSAPIDKSPEEYQWLRRRVREITDLAPKL